MAEPTSALSFYGMILRVAEAAGMAYYGTDGQKQAMIPIDAYNLDRCRRICNDGFRLFLASSPIRGWYWRNRTASITFNITGAGTENIATDPARYMLPQDFAGNPAGRIEYDIETNNGAQIRWCDPSFIRSRRATTIQTGYPTAAAVLPYQPSAPPALGASRRWELIVDPQPVAADTVVFPYTSSFNKMDVETGIATGGSATTLVDSTRLEADDYFKTWILRIVEGAGKGRTITITGYTASTGTFTFATSGAVVPTATSIYYVEPAANLHPAGFMYDDVVLAACLAEAEKQIEEVSAGLVELFYKVHLPQAHLIDGLNRPRSLGNMQRQSRRGRNWLDVTTEHDL